MCKGYFVGTTNVVFSPSGKVASGTPSHYNCKRYYLTARHNKDISCIIPYKYIPDNSLKNESIM